MSLITNPSFPTAASVNGGGVGWSNIDNVFTEGTGAQTVMYTSGSNHYTQTLQGTNIAWLDSHGNLLSGTGKFPSEAQILGIEMDVTGQQTGGTSATYLTYTLLGPPATPKNDSYGSPQYGSLSTVALGNSTDLWGCSKILPAQLNDPDFGWGIKCTCTQAPGIGSDFTLFYVVLKVTYAINANVDQAWCFNVWGLGGIILGNMSVVNLVVPYILPTSWTPAGYTQRYSNRSCWISDLIATIYGGAVTASYVSSPGVPPVYSRAFVSGTPSIAHTAQATDYTQTITVSFSNPPTPGDTLLAVCCSQDGGVGPIIGYPGFTQLSSYGTGPTTWMGYRIVQAGDGADWSFKFSSGAGGGDLVAYVYDLAGATGVSASSGLAIVAGDNISTGS
jgi:hypothetical protein